MAAQSIRNIAQMSQYQLEKLTKAELKEMFQALQGSTRSRLQTFKKHGRLTGAPKAVRRLAMPKSITYGEGEKRPKPISKFTKKDYMRAIGTLGNFYLSEKGTYTGYVRVKKKERKALEERLGIKLTEESIKDLGEFLGAMRERAGDMFPAHYEAAIQLFDVAREKHMDPTMFMKNYEYWTEQKHLDALAEAKEIKRGREVYPSDYVKALGLPSIRKYNAGDKEKRVIWSKDNSGKAKG